MRNGIFATFSTAMLVVTLAPRPHPAQPALQLQVAWLAQRESALGEWESVKPPLREGDELQLTVLASDDAHVYVFDGEQHQLFPVAGGSARVQAHWPYAIPGAHRTWRLDDADHDRLHVVAARHPLAHPTAYLDGDHSGREGPDLILPLRDGRRGGAVTRMLAGDGVLSDTFVAR